MNYTENVKQLLKENMSERGYSLWEGINKMLPNIWELPTSSTKKYHLKEDGSCPDNAEHTFEMLYACVKLFRMYDVKSKTSNADMFLFAISFHDLYKYGKFGSQVHTNGKHDKLMADLIQSNKATFLKILNEKEFDLMVKMIRFHSGRWSTDVGNINEFDFNDYPAEVQFIHMLDMMSTKDLIKIWKKDL